MDNVIDIRIRKRAERLQVFAISCCVCAGMVLYPTLSRLFSRILGFAYSLMDEGMYLTLAGSSIFNNCVYIIYALICVTLPFFIFHLISRKCFGTRLPFSKPRKGSSLGSVTIIGLGMCVLGNYATLIFTLVSEALFHSTPTGAPEDVTSASQISLPGFFVSVIATAVVAALAEEFAIRGVVMQPLRRFGDRFAIVVSALIFSVIHGNFQQIPFAFVVGLALGYVVIRTESIWAGVLLHFINNFWAVCSEYLSYLVPETLFAVIYYTTNLIICVVAIICAIRLYKKDVGAGITSGIFKKPICLISGFEKLVFVVISPTFLLGMGDLLYGAFQNFMAV